MNQKVWFPWALVRLPFLGEEKSRIVGRFHNRADADGHQAFLQKELPHLKFSVVWDVSEDGEIAA